MLPYTSDHRPTHIPVATWALLGITALASMWVLLGDRLYGPGRTAEMLTLVGLVPARMHPLTLFTYPFFHAGIGHLMINLFYLWVFGAGVEEAVGRSRFILLYLACGAVGGLLQWLVTITLVPQGAYVPIVGASAACAGLMGLFAVRYYRARLSFVGLPFRPHVVYVVSAFLFIEIGLGLYALITGQAPDGVAHWAHIAGFIFGLSCARALKLSDIGSNAYLSADAAQAMAKSVPGAAIKKWELLLLREPGHPGYLIELARAWMLLGDTETAGSYYIQALEVLIAKARRMDAAALYSEMRGSNVSVPLTGDLKNSTTTLSVSSILMKLTTQQLFILGSCLEEQEQYAYAAEAFRAVTVRAANTPEAETALLKASALYVRYLGRASEGRILLRLFLERYPHSPYRALAEDLRRQAGPE